MPIYEYAAITGGCEHCQAHFDVLQKLSEPPLTHCPHCGCAVHRVISPPNLAMGSSGLLKDKHAERHGFTQYRRAEKGVYEKAYGKGPKYISDK
jgi:putative FmdB family regulatory protein